MSVNMGHQFIHRFANCRIHLRLAALIAALVLGQSQSVLAQGCVNARGTGMTACQHEGHLADVLQPQASGLQLSVGYRWLHSDRMFIGDVEQPQRQAEGSQEINDSHFIDIGLSYAFTPRFSATLTVPFAEHDRSQVVRAVNVRRTILGRFHTRAQGLGDLRLEGNAWLLNPQKHRKGNLLLGLGFSAPSGDRDVQDAFKIPSGTNPRTEMHAVDPSIQLGNGGWGILLDAYGYREILPRLNGFVNGFYTITPEEKYTPTASLMGDYSIADSYLGRAGLEYVIWPKHSLALSLAGRIEGVPVRDLAGGSNGFRRPGYAVSIEPGVSLAIKSWSFAVNAPVALYRNRLSSVEDSAAGRVSTPASFADFLLTVSVTKKF